MTIRHAWRVMVIATSCAIAACGSNQSPTAPTLAAAAPASTPAPAIDSASGDTARYRLTFTATWSAATHPIDFPSTAHFSNLVGGTHTNAVSFWSEGAIATQGIQDMAERGRTTPLDQEIAAAVRAGTAGAVWTGGGIGQSPGSTTLDFEISRRFPLATFVSMIAPSPDWFVGVSGVPLFENGEWVAERRISLVPWDAGTDSGITFNSPDRETQPHAGISRILTAPLSPNANVTPVGTFTFTRLAN